MLAAVEYERVTQDNKNYLTSVSRLYERKSVISYHRPMRLYLKIDPITAKVADPQMKAREIAQMCLKYKIDGVVIQTLDGTRE